jgi:hypothetical protein
MNAAGPQSSVWICSGDDGDSKSEPSHVWVGLNKSIIRLGRFGRVKASATPALGADRQAYHHL